MKKSSLVLLTIVAALTISSCVVQKTAENLGPPDPMYVEEISDTTKSIRDTTVGTSVSYNYYYRSYFWDGMYRAFFPHRYYYVINQPGYRPRHLRPVLGVYAHRDHHPVGPHSGRRGGFGQSGTAHTGHS